MWNSAATAGLAAALILGALPARSQDLDAGKNAQQLFSSNCSACHRSPRGLAKGRSGGALTGFLAQHYTTGRRSAAELAGYLASVGGAAPREPARTPDSAHARTPDERSAAPSHQRSASERRARKEERAHKRAEAEAKARKAALAAQARHRHSAGEPAIVEDDPPPVEISEKPVALVHERSISRAQETRDWAAFAASLVPPPPPPVAAAPEQQHATAAAGQETVAAPAQATPVAPADSTAPAMAAGPTPEEAPTQAGAGDAAGAGSNPPPTPDPTIQPFAVPLP